MGTRVRQAVTSPAFHTIVIAAILVNVVVATMEGYPALASSEWGAPLRFVDTVVLVIFSVEITLRIAAERPLTRFFRSAWNWFDFLIVAASLIFYPNPSIAIARIFRLLRVLRALSVFRNLQGVVRALVGSLPAIGNILLLLGVHLYFFAVMGTVLFHRVAPEQFGTPHQSMLTLFGVITLDSWGIVMKEVMAGVPFAWIYFLIFLVSGSFVLLNLAVGVIVSSLDDARQQARQEEDKTELSSLRVEVQALTAAVQRLPGSAGGAAVPPRQAGASAGKATAQSAAGSSATVAVQQGEHRAYPRLALTRHQAEAVQTYQVGPNGDVPELLPEVITVDLSMGGAGLTGHPYLPAGTLVELHLCPPGTTEVIATRGQVVRAPPPTSGTSDGQGSYRFGVQFDPGHDGVAAQLPVVLQRLVI